MTARRDLGRLRPVCAALALAAPVSALALDRFEIQVYEADINDPGQPGIEVHLNYTARGIREPEYPGQVPPYHAARITFEPAIGVTEFLELGAYVQLYTAPGVDGGRFGGWKLRTKWVLPERVQHELGIPLFLGLNVELGKVPFAIEEAGWANEFRPIVGWKSDRWLVAVNPIFGYALTGADRFQPDLEPAAKVAWNTHLGFSIGAEYYASLGLIGEGFLPVNQQEHLLLGVVDLVDRPHPAEGPASSPAHASPWELNVGVGGALTDATGQHLLVKAIVGRSF